VSSHQSNAGQTPVFPKELNGGGQLPGISQGLMVAAQVAAAMASNAMNDDPRVIAQRAFQLSDLLCDIDTLRRKASIDAHNARKSERQEGGSWGGK
jgi:hypothetical protein